MALKLKVSREDVWAASVKDQPGGVAEKLSALAAAKVNLKFVIARRSSKSKKGGVVFVTPLKGAAQLRAAKAAGFKKAKSLYSVRVEGSDRRGLGAKMTTALAGKGINLRGVSAASLGGKFVCYFAVDGTADAAKAVRTLKAL